MAQTSYTPIYLYASGTAGHIPLAANLTNTTNGSEIALNYADGNLFFKNSANSVITTPLLQSNGSQNGWLSSTDWTTFNNKSPAAGSSSIITVGTITSGTWNGSTIDVAHGGTGLTTLTTSYIPYGNGTSAFQSTSAFQYDSSGNLRINDTAALSGTNTSNNLVCSNDISTGSYRIGSSNSFLGRQSSDGSTILNTGQANLIFSSGAYGSTTTMALFDTSQNFVIGASSNTGNGERLFVSTVALTPFVGRHASTAAGKFWYFGPNNGNAFVVNNQNSAGVYITDGATSWTGTSDIRFKNIVEPIANACEKVKKIRSVIGRYKNDNENIRRSFLIAQDFCDVLPEAVDASNPDKLGLSYSDTIPLIFAALNEIICCLDLINTQK